MILSNRTLVATKIPSGDTGRMRRAYFLIGPANTTADGTVVPMQRQALAQAVLQALRSLADESGPSASAGPYLF